MGETKTPLFFYLFYFLSLLGSRIQDDMEIYPVIMDTKVV